MAGSDANRAPTDLAAVNLGEPWEIHYWCNHFNCSEKAIKAAMKKTGSINPEEISAYLETKKPNRRT